MKLVWDTQKRNKNLQKHGLAFEDAYQVFMRPALEFLDDRFEYGEDRWVAIGMLGVQCVAVVYTEQGEALRVISMRKATKEEQNAYEKAVLF